VALYMMGGVLWYGMGSEQSWFGIPAGTRALKLSVLVVAAMAAYFVTLRLLGLRLRQFSRQES
jgi:putative peptidoglycan lipid II flippase